MLLPCPKPWLGILLLTCLAVVQMPVHATNNASMSGSTSGNGSTADTTDTQAGTATEGVGANQTPVDPGSYEASRWTVRQINRMRRNDTNTTPAVFGKRQQLMPGYWIWDSWPLRNRDGSIASLNGWKIWMSLTAEDSLLPGQRHDTARIRYLASRDGINWKPMGLVFPIANAYGSRNWASDAIFLPETQEIVMLYTATGERDENCRANGERSLCDKPITYTQKIAWAKGKVVVNDQGVNFTDWQHKLLLEPDGRLYQTPEQTGGQLYAFRDPFFYFDPADGRQYLLFEANTAAPGQTGGVPNPGGGSTGSGSTGGSGTGQGGGSGSSGSSTGGGSGSGLGTGSGSPGGPLSGQPIGVVEFNGAIGIAEAVGDNSNLDSWRLLPPIFTANAVNQELERPHMLNRDGRYYLFLDSHIGKFAPGLAAGPEGLYGWVADSLFGPYRPLNRSGLVLGNPTTDAGRFQAYSWYVLPDWSVTSFQDYFNLPPGVDISTVANQSSDFQRQQFGGTYMPLWHLAVNRNKTQLVVTDVNRDGSTNYDDLEPIVKAYGASRGEANYNRWLDMNRDGEINQLDALFVERYALPTVQDPIVRGLDVPVAPLAEGQSEPTPDRVPPRFRSGRISATPSGINAGSTSGTGSGSGSGSGGTGTGSGNATPGGT